MNTIEKIAQHIADCTVQGMTCKQIAQSLLSLHDDCPECDGTGQVPDYDSEPLHRSYTNELCPACHGKGGEKLLYTREEHLTDKYMAIRQMSENSCIGCYWSKGCRMFSDDCEWYKRFLVQELGQSFIKRYGL